MIDPVVVAVLLGFVQGVTEFLPISSDGHLSLARAIVGGTPAGLGTTLVMHLGTLLATVLVLRSDVARLLVEPFRSIRARAWDAPALREALAVVAASVPTAAIGLGLHDVVESTSDDLRVVSACLLVTAACVVSTRWSGHGRLDVPDLRAALLIGVVQGLAVLPGWSRSGSTIAAAMALGLSPAASFRFSFVLSMPAILGATLLELRDPIARASLAPLDALAACVAFVVGYVALRALRSVVDAGRFAWFAAYLIPLALVVGLRAFTAPATP